MAVDSIADTVARSSNVNPARPTFRIQQLVVLMAVMAVMLAATGPRDIQSLGFSPAVQLAIGVARVIYALLASIAITIVGYGFLRRRQGQSFLNEPGHWLLVTISANEALVLTEVLLISIVATIRGTDTSAVWMQIPFFASWLIPGAALAILNLYIARRKCGEARWIRVFYAKAAAAIMPVIGDLLVLIFLERAVRAERARRPVSARWRQSRGVAPITGGQIASRSHDAAHWCGVAMAFFMSSVMLLFIIGIVGYIILPAFFG